MSLPITAVGPLNVETKPILTVSPASAGLASTNAIAPASQNAFFIFVSPPSLSKPIRSSRPIPPSGSTADAVRYPPQGCCARNLRLAASPNRASALEPSALLQHFMHHNSHELAMAR